LELAVGYDDVADLIQRCIREDDQARAYFYAEHIETIRRAARRQLLSLSNGASFLDDVDDIANDVFARLFADDCRVLRSIRTPEAIGAWLVTVARRRALDYARKWEAQGAASFGCVAEAHEVYSVSNADRQALESERDHVLGRCLGALTDEERLLLRLFYEQGRKHVEIAEITGKNINTVSAKLRRARLKLRRLLEEERYEGCF
jgi:RNA polymerase sigma-70 factor (ECF subfamily)